MKRKSVVIQAISLIIVVKLIFSSCAIAQDCSTINNWMQVFEKEYHAPYKLQRNNTHTYFRNMFTDKYFTPVFGKPFQSLSKSELKKIYKTYEKCEENKSLVKLKFKNRYDSYTNLFKPFNPNTQGQYSTESMISFVEAINSERVQIEEFIDKLSTSAFNDLVVFKNKIKNMELIILPSEIHDLDQIIQKRENELNEEVFAGDNPENRGYKLSKYLFKHQNTDYFIISSSSGLTLIAFHDMKDLNQKILEFDIIEVGDKKQWAYSEEMLRKFREVIQPKTFQRFNIKKQPFVEIKHYIKDQIFDGEYHQGPIEAPVITTKYIYKKDTWMAEQKTFLMEDHPIDVNGLLKNQEEQLAEYQHELALAAEKSKKYMNENQIKTDEIYSHEKELYEIASQGGYVYKNIFFWMQFTDDSYLLKDLFNGDWTESVLNVEYATYYLSFLHLLSDHCYKERNDLTMRVPAENVLNGIDDDYRSAKLAYINPRYSMDYKQIRYVVAKNKINFYTYREGSTQNVSRKLINQYNDVKLFLDCFECNSKAINQMLQNMHSAINKSKKSIQKTGEKVYGVDEPNDNVIVNSSNRNIYTSCMEFHGLSKRYNEWCNCLNRRLTPLISRERKVENNQDFNSLRQEIFKYPKKGNKDPAWKYYSAYNDCRE